MLAKQLINWDRNKETPSKTVHKQPESQRDQFYGTEKKILPAGRSSCIKSLSLKSFKSVGMDLLLICITDSQIGVKQTRWVFMCFRPSFGSTNYQASPLEFIKKYFFKDTPGIVSSKYYKT